MVVLDCIGLYRIATDCIGLYRIIQDRAGLYGLVQYCTGLCTGLHRICAGAPLLYFLLIFVCCPRSCGSSLASVFVNHSVLHVLSLFL